MPSSADERVDIDPNLQDVSLVIGNIDWVLAEFVRLYHGVKADEAQRIIDASVVRTVPCCKISTVF